MELMQYQSFVRSVEQLLWLPLAFMTCSFIKLGDISINYSGKTWLLSELYEELCFDIDAYDM